MGHPADSSTLGIWPFQDHEEGVDITIRQRLVGGRVERIEEPGKGDGYVHYALDEGRGTIGDVHPFVFWQAREERGFGSWNAMFAAVSQGGVPSGRVTTPSGGSSGNPEGRDHPVFRAGGATRPDLGRGGDGRGGEPAHSQQALPIRYDDYSEDARYFERVADQPEYLQLYPRGFRLIAAGGTHEGAQENLLLPADGRLVAVQAFPHDEMGTIVSDLVSEGELGSEGPYGGGGRDAPLQTLAWVVRLPAIAGLETVRGNAVALNGTRTQQGEMAGFIPFVGKALFGGPPGGGGQDDPVRPTTPSGGLQTGDTEAGRNPEGLDHPVFRTPGGAVPPNSRAPGSEGGPAPRTRGAGRAPVTGTAVGLVSHEAAGPWVAGFHNDVHNHGQTLDGQPVNAGHLHVDAYWIRDDGADGPHEHNPGTYPKPKKIGYPWVVEMLWDPTDVHPFMDGVRPGKWRRVAYVPLIPGGPPTREPRDPPTREPRDPPTTPREPDDPGGGGFPDSGRGAADDEFGLPPGNDAPAPMEPDLGGGGKRGGGGTLQDPGLPGPRNEPPIWFPPESDTVQAYDHSNYSPQPIVDAPMQMGQTSISWRAQPLTQGKPDLRYDSAPATAARAELDTRPIVHRTEAIALELDSGEFSYQRLPDRSRNVGGEAASGGGVWHLPAVFDAVDYRDGEPDSSIEYASTYRGFADGICVAFGLPSNTQGVQDGGLRLLREGSGLKMQEIASGAWGSHTPTDGDHLVPYHTLAVGTYQLKLRPDENGVGGTGFTEQNFAAHPAKKTWTAAVGAGVGPTTFNALWQTVVPRHYDKDVHTLTARLRLARPLQPNTTHTVQAYVYEDGAGADIGPGAASNLAAAGYTDYDFAVTGTNLVAGDRLTVVAEVVLDDTGGAGGGQAALNAVELVVTKT